MRALRYYFRDSGNKRLFLLLVGLLFFIWTYRNILILRRLKSFNSLRDLNLEYLPSGFIVSAFVIVFSIAPLFDLHAPATIQSLCSSSVGRSYDHLLEEMASRFSCIGGQAILYICFSLTHHVPDPGFLYRCLFIYECSFYFLDCFSFKDANAS